MFWLGKSIERDSDKSSGSSKDDKLNISPLEMIILVKLRSRELRSQKDLGQYGYELMDDLTKLFGGQWEAKSGTIYPLLSKLESEKKLILGERKPSPLGPVKKVYALTEVGRKTIDEIINERWESDLDFILAYYDMLTPFILTIPENEKADELLEKLMMLPSKMPAKVMEKVVTDVDVDLRKRRLQIMQRQLEEILINIKKELDKLK